MKNKQVQGYFYKENCTGKDKPYLVIKRGEKMYVKQTKEPIDELMDVRGWREDNLIQEWRDLAKEIMIATNSKLPDELEIDIIDTHSDSIEYKMCKIAIEKYKIEKDFE